MSAIDVKRLFQACNPSATLNIANSDDKKYYLNVARNYSIVVKHTIKQGVAK